VTQVIEQTTRRILDQEKIPAGEKIVSMFEAHRNIIQRNKARLPTEYGHKVWLDEVEGELVTRWKVLAGNPNDDQQWRPVLEHHQERFGHPPNQASRDRGVHSLDTEGVAKENRVQRIILPQSGYKCEERKQHEKQAWYRCGRNWHVGVEGRISVLKRRFGLDRCLDHRKMGFEKWVAAGE
jgi:IS5 family transposase